MKKPRFRKISSPAQAPAMEEAMVEFWDKKGTFRRSVAERPIDRNFVFYEGPPTANGTPGVHHVMARLCKDVVCRYKTMRGYRVVRKAGWDTHGLPVEIEVENELGFKSKGEIEAYGVGRFNARCRRSVFRYEKEWERFTKRIGYWLDLGNPYITCTNEYIESVWWILKEFWKKGFLYEGHKIVPYCPRCGTSLSSHEVSQGYRDVSDPSVFVLFPEEKGEWFFLVWTTTPWTLISNAALAVQPSFRYALVEHQGRRLVLAEERLGVLEGSYRVIDRFCGRELEGRRYAPLFPFFAGEQGAFRVVPGEFVTVEEGTGIVHIAPAFGEDDYKLHVSHGVPLFQPVTPTGTFTDRVEPWAGKGVKEADPSIIDDLAQRGLLYRSGKVRHSYPFCWRCDTALIYYARRSWYIRTTAFKEKLLEANAKVNWIPKEVGEYRFGNWLENNVDWALSRERYWGTPLNIWVCSSCGKDHAVGSIEELRSLCRNLPSGEELDLHKPQVDELLLCCPHCGRDMRRVREVIDCWFDSGSMPFAQYHYPFGDRDLFQEQFPADFICEGIDQSRGWFYSLLVIAAFLKGESPYRNVLTTELVLDKYGQKMSKSRGNAIEPWDVLENEGADALRWYLLVSSPPWLPTRFDRKGVVEAAQKLLGTLRNVYSFFAMYAEVDDYRPGAMNSTRNRLDRWILSRYASVAVKAKGLMDRFEITRAARLLQSFVLDELSNWYVRRSRRRFWKGESGPDKQAAYDTLATVLIGVIRMLAPLVPFLTEEIYQALREALGSIEGLSKGSVHLEPYPEPSPDLVDPALEELMATAVTVCSLGRTVRNEAGIKIRQPLLRLYLYDREGKVERLLADEEIRSLVEEELHVKGAAPARDLEAMVEMIARPCYPSLGKKFGKRVPKVAEALGTLGWSELAEAGRRGEITLKVEGEEVKLVREDFTLEVKGRDRFGAREQEGIIVVLDMEIDEELKIEGMAREVVNRLQNLRKGAGLEVTDRIRVRFQGGPWARKVLSRQRDFVCSETLAVGLEEQEADWKDTTDLELEGERLTLWIRRETD